MRYLLILFSASLLVFSCEVEQTQEGEMPEVSVEEGEMPEYEVNWADVDVRSTTRTVKVPKIVMEEREIEVPVIDFQMPKDMDGEKEERTIVVEAEVEGRAHEIDIEEAYVSNNNLYVIAELEAEEQELNGETMRVSDRIVVNAPDLNVKYYIIGDKPQGDFNNQYRFIASRSDISDELSNAKKIY
jgi:hypothetical protein